MVKTFIRIQFLRINNIIAGSAGEGLMAVSAGCITVIDNDLSWSARARFRKWDYQTQS